MNTIQIFSTSFNPDVYINAIVHFVHEHEQKTNIELVVIFQDSTEKKQKEGRYKKTLSSIKEVLKDLASGIYKTTDGDRKPREVKLEDDEKKFYQDALNFINDFMFKSIIYSELRKEVIERINNAPSDYKYIFDLTGERKYLLVDILFICLDNDYRNLFVFDILKSPNYQKKEENLIHNLDNNQYEFRNLFESKFTKEIVEKGILNYTDSELEGKVKNLNKRLESSSKTIESLRDENKRIKVLEGEKAGIKGKLEQTNDQYSSFFAKAYLIPIIGVGFLLLYYLNKSKTWVSTQWDSLEPLTFVYFAIGIPIVIWILSALLIIVFGKDSMTELKNPIGIFKILKNYKKTKLKL